MPGRIPRVTKTEALVLRHRRFGDADRIVTLLTPDRGKIDAVAKGVLRPRSKLAGHLEPAMHVELVLAHGRNLDIVTQAQTVDGFRGLHDDLDRLSTAMYLTELTDRLTVEHAEARGVYALLRASLARLARGDGLHLVTRSFELELLAITGFRPEWHSCVACGGEVEERSVSWSATAGGVLCGRCRPAHPEARPIDGTTLKVLRAFQAGPYDQAARIRLSPQLATTIERVMHDLTQTVAERELTGQRFVTAARRAAALARDGRATGVAEPDGASGDDRDG